MEIIILIVFLFTAFGGLVGWDLNRRRKKRHREVPLLARLAHALELRSGISELDGGPQLEGIVDERHVELRPEPGGSTLILSVLIRPALDLGLLVEPQGFADHGRARSVPTGDGSFDHRLAAWADEPLRAVSLLSAPVRSLLLRLLSASQGLRLTDDRLQVRLPVLWASSGSPPLPQLIRHAVSGVTEIERLREALPAARALQPYVPAWSSFARQHELALSRAPLGLRGNLRGRDVWAVAVRTAPGTHLLDVAVWFEPPLGIALSVQPSLSHWQRQPARAQRDGPTGSFARAFLVGTHQPQTAAALLDESLEHELLRLYRQHGPPALTHKWLWVRRPELPHEPEAALHAMEDVAEFAHHFAVRARELCGNGLGPYRARP